MIGGTCVELQSGSARLLLDLGMPLDADPEVVDATVLLPDIPGLHSPDPALLALIISHGHADHWGLAPHVTASVPVVMGAATRRIMCAAAPFVPYPATFDLGDTAAGELVDRVPLRIGPFTITPFLMDHSAYDAYALVIEAGGVGCSIRAIYAGMDPRRRCSNACWHVRLAQSTPC